MCRILTSPKGKINAILLGKKPFENIVGKGAFSPLPIMFSTLPKVKFGF